MGEEDVKKIVEPIQSKLENIVSEAWQYYRDLPEPTFSTRTRANIVWDRMAALSHQWAAYEPNIRTIEKNNTIMFVLDKKLLFRFKKGDSQGYTKNVQTKLALAYHDPQLEIPGVSSTHRVDIVYKLNPLETEIEDICVVSRTNNVVDYSFSIKSSGAANVTEINLEVQSSTSIAKLKTELQEEEKKDGVQDK